MPEIFSLSTDRRTFIRKAFLAGAAVALPGCSTARPTRGAKGELHLALLSDTHIPGDPNNEYRGFKPWSNLQRVVPAVVASRPAGVLLNGDAARLAGLTEDYAQLRQLLAPIATVSPVCIGMGNHDDRANFLKAFADRPGLSAEVQGKHVTIIEHPVARLVQLDSLLYVDKVAGLLGKAQRAWLASFLAGADARPVVLVVHHTLGDGDGDLLDVNLLFDILRPHRKVKAIFYGHSHVWAFGEREGVRLINLPAVGYNFRDEDPVGWVESRFGPKGVELTLRSIGGNQTDNGKTTRIDWLR